MPASLSPPSRRDRKSSGTVGSLKASMKAQAASPDGTGASRSPGRHTSNSSATGDSARQLNRTRRSGSGEAPASPPVRIGGGLNTNLIAAIPLRVAQRTDRATETPRQRAGLSWPRLPAAAELATIGVGYGTYALVRLAIRAAGLTVRAQADGV